MSRTTRFMSVSRSDGRFSLLDVPAGRYELTVWHPPLAGGDEPITVRRQVTVRAVKRTTVTIKL